LLIPPAKHWVPGKINQQCVKAKNWLMLPVKIKTNVSKQPSKKPATTLQAQKQMVMNPIVACKKKN